MQELFFGTEHDAVLLKKQEKAKIRVTAMFIGIAMLVTVVVAVFFAPIYISLLSLFGVSATDAVRYAKDPVVLQLVNQIISIVMFVFPFYIVLSGCGLKTRDAISFSTPKKKTFLPVFLMSLGFCGFANIGSSTIVGFLESVGINIPNNSIVVPDGVMGTIISIVGAAVVAPLTEEFAMRGVVMGSLRRYGDRFAICVSAVLFGLMHTNLQQIPFAFIVGLALGFAVIKTDSIWTGIAVHSANNLIATVITIVSTKLPIEISMLLNLGFFALCLISAFVGILMLRENDDKVLIQKDNKILSERKAAASFFTSPFIIAYLVLAAYETVTRI